MSHLYLGIDTSNYRTSVALVDETGSVIAEKTVLLDVPKGERGLRQSEAFFKHSNRLPEYISELFAGIDTSLIAAIGVSERPRRVEGSYMPCFNAGVNAASIIGSSRGVPVYRFSHQEGHAAAILESKGREAPRKAIFFHLSGGTTEALICRPDEDGYSMEIAGGTLDISIGQLLDRYGVAMGFPFPSGQYLDDMAFAALEEKGFDAGMIPKTNVIPKIKISDGYFNLSGAETRLMQFAKNDGADKMTPDVTAELFVSIARLLKDDAKYLSDKYDIKDTYMAGGVASSRTVRRLLAAEENLYFGDPKLSGDNAVGTALLAKRKHETGNSQAGK